MGFGFVLPASHSLSLSSLPLSSEFALVSNGKPVRVPLSHPSLDIIVLKWSLEVCFALDFQEGVCVPEHLANEELLIEVKYLKHD